MLTLSTAAQSDELAFRRESYSFIEGLSEAEAFLENMKRLAEVRNIDIEKAVVNATQETIVGAEPEEDSSLRKRRAIRYGVIVTPLSINAHEE